mgnify:CR=1 FL=1
MSVVAVFSVDDNTELIRVHAGDVNVGPSCVSRFPAVAEELAGPNSISIFNGNRGHMRSQYRQPLNRVPDSDCLTAPFAGCIVAENLAGKGTIKRGTCGHSPIVSIMARITDRDIY